MSRQNLTVTSTVLVAPLDWGLGHATRCIPIIKELLYNNYTVLIVASGSCLTLLKTEFPNLTFLPLRGYEIKYAAGKWSTIFKVLAQISKILRDIRTENKWLQTVVTQYAIDAVISDNRYGLYNKDVYSVFITHQLTIKTPLGSWTEQLLQKINYSFINRFNMCWVPDFKEAENLGGALSHPDRLPAVPICYMGALSRFKASPSPGNHHLLILLSGPEPQRTLLEHLLLQQLSPYTQPVVFVRGLPNETAVPTVKNNMVIVNHLPLQEMQAAIQNASFIISRCGYSTVMDVITMQKRSLLIPTPGQTEQEYLASYLMEKKWALCFTQKAFHLSTALQLAGSFQYVKFEAGTSALTTIINNLGEKLLNRRTIQQAGS